MSETNMSKNKTPKTPKPAQTDEQRAAAAEARHEKRLDLLNATVADICERIHDDERRGLTARAIKSRTVDLKVKVAALNAIRAAVDDAEAAITRAAGGDEGERARRIDLRSV